MPTDTPADQSPCPYRGISFKDFLALSPEAKVEFLHKAGGQPVTVRIPRQPVLKSVEDKSA